MINSSAASSSSGHDEILDLALRRRAQRLDARDVGVAFVDAIATAQDDADLALALQLQEEVGLFVVVDVVVVVAAE
jgi:hypothetical protein